jgi:hypothetical protein
MRSRPGGASGPSSRRSISHDTTMKRARPSCAPSPPAP